MKSQMETAAEGQTSDSQEPSGRSDSYFTQEEVFGAGMPEYKFPAKEYFPRGGRVDSGYGGLLAWRVRELGEESIDVCASIEAIKKQFPIATNADEMVLGVLAFCDSDWQVYRSETDTGEGPSLFLVHRYLLKEGWDSWFFLYAVAFDFCSSRYYGFTFPFSLSGEVDEIDDLEDLELAVDNLREKVKYGLDETLLSKCVGIADLHPYVLGKNGKYNRFLKLLQVLQEMTPGQSFPIAQEPIAKALGYPQQRISEMVSRAIRDGLLNKTLDHSYTKHRAAEYELVF